MGLEIANVGSKVYEKLAKNESGSAKSPATDVFTQAKKDKDDPSYIVNDSNSAEVVEVNTPKLKPLEELHPAGIKLLDEGGNTNYFISSESPTIYIKDDGDNIKVKNSFLGLIENNSDNLFIELAGKSQELKREEMDYDKDGKKDLVLNIIDKETGKTLQTTILQDQFNIEKGKGIEDLAIYDKDAQSLAFKKLKN